jgi:hypothetical protein
MERASSVWRSVEFFLMVILGATAIGLLCVAVA